MTRFVFILFSLFVFYFNEMKQVDRSTLFKYTKISIQKGKQTSKTY